MHRDAAPSLWILVAAVALAGCPSHGSHRDNDDGSIDRDADGKGDSGAPRCTAPLPPLPVTQGPFDCMARGWAADGNISGSADVPALPFYQPEVTAATVDDVAYSTAALPTNNRYVVYDGWLGPAPLIPITSWRISQFTKLDFADPVSDHQRGQADSYGSTGMQVQGKTVGMWLNTADPGVVLYSGSASMNSGCWYQTSPYPPLFPSGTHVLDVSFDAAVPTDMSSGNAHGQAYFQLIAVDRSGGCGDHCAFSFSLNFYSQYSNIATDKNVAPDATGTLTLILAGAGLDSTGWTERMPDSMGYQTAPFNTKHVHVRLSPAGFIAIRNEVAARAPGHAGLSTNPLDYDLSLLNVNAELYDPCKDKSHIRPCLGSENGQMAMVVSDFRVTSVVPHTATGRPVGSAAAVLFQNSDGNVQAFTDLPHTASFALASVLTETAGNPAIFSDKDGLVHALARTSDGHLRHATLTDAWHGDDALSAITDVASDPSPLVDTAGAIHIVYRDGSGNVREARRTGNLWTARTLAEDAASHPAVYGTTEMHVVYVDSHHHVKQVDADLQTRDLSDWTDAPDAYADPQGVVAEDGTLHVIYRDISGGVHELFRGTDGSWEHRAIGEAPPALGSPRIVRQGCFLSVVYPGVDHHVHHVRWDGVSWTHEDLTAIRGALLTADDVTAYLDSAGLLRIAYRGTDNQLHEFLGGASWLHRDM